MADEQERWCGIGVVLSPSLHIDFSDPEGHTARYVGKASVDDISTDSHLWGLAKKGEVILGVREYDPKKQSDFTELGSVTEAAKHIRGPGGSFVDLQIFNPATGQTRIVPQIMRRGFFFSKQGDKTMFIGDDKNCPVNISSIGKGTTRLGQLSPALSPLSPPVAGTVGRPGI